MDYKNSILKYCIAFLTHFNNPGPKASDSKFIIKNLILRYKSSKDYGLIICCYEKSHFRLRIDVRIIH